MNDIDTYGLTKEEIREEAEDIRVDGCGAYVCGPSITGEFKVRRLSCGVFLKCPRCAEKRADRARDDIERAMRKKMGQRLYMVEISSHEDTVEVAREIGKEAFRRFPQPDGSVVLFVEEPVEGLDNEPVTVRNIDSIDWGAITLTPKGRKLSGGLGKPVVPEVSRGGKTLVKYEAYRSDASRSEAGAAFDEAVKRTHDLNPTDAEELQSALKKRNKAFRSELIKAGFTIMSRWPIKRLVETLHIEPWAYVKISKKVPKRRKQIDPERWYPVRHAPAT